MKDSKGYHTFFWVGGYFLAFSKKTNGDGLLSLIRPGCVMEIETGIAGLHQR